MPPPGMTNYTYALGEQGFVFNTDSQGLPFVDITEIKGLDVAPIRMNINERESVDGSYVNANHTSMRTIVITGTVYSNPNNIDPLLDRLRADYASTTLSRFYFQHPGRPLRFCNAQGGGFQYSIDTNWRLGITDFQATLLCGDPYIYDYPGWSATATLNSSSTPTALNANVDFEEGIGTTPWTGANGATLSLSTSFSHSSSHSAAITPNGSTANPQMLSEQCQVVVGNTTACLGWIYSASSWGSGVRVNINWYTSLGAFISTTTGPNFTLAANTWTQIGCTATTPATARFAQMVIQINGTPLATQLFYADDCGVFATIGVGWPIGFALGFGAAAPPNQVTVYNLGTHTAYPLVILNGPMSSPQVVDSLTNVTMTLGLNLGASDEIIIDNNAKTIIMNATVNVRSFYNGIKWVSIPAGKNDTFILNSASGTGTMTVQAFNTYY